MWFLTLNMTFHYHSNFLNHYNIKTLIVSTMTQDARVVSELCLVEWNVGGFNLRLVTFGKTYPIHNH